MTWAELEPGDVVLPTYAPPWVVTWRGESDGIQIVRLLDLETGAHEEAAADGIPFDPRVRVMRRGENVNR